MLLAFVGACAGSTGGGLKVVRFLIVGRAALRGVRQFARPRAIHVVRIDDDTLDEGVVASVTGYFGCGSCSCSWARLALSLIGVDLVTASTAVAGDAQQHRPGPGASRAVH